MLASDSSGRILAGTESPGRLYRLDANDRPFVLLDSGLAELRAVSNAPNGVIYAAGVAKGDESSPGGETTSVAVTLTVPGVYDYFCAPHEVAGMVGRIIVGRPGGPGTAAPGEDVPPAAQAAFPSVQRIMAEGIVRPSRAQAHIPSHRRTIATWSMAR